LPSSFAASYEVSAVCSFDEEVTHPVASQLTLFLQNERRLPISIHQLSVLYYLPEIELKSGTEVTKPSGIKRRQGVAM